MRWTVRELRATSSKMDGAKVVPAASKDGKADKDAKQEKKEKQPMASMSELFRYATAFDWLCITLGIIGGTVQGASQPLQMIIFADFFDASAVQNPMDMFVEIALTMTWLGVITFVCGWVGNTCFEAAGMAIAARWRREYLKGILRQDVAWFDTSNPFCNPWVMMNGKYFQNP